MHELGITENIVRISVEEAEKNNALKITEIRIKVGRFSDLVPECIQQYFDVISEGTKAQGAILKIERLPLLIKCRNCNEQSENFSNNNSICPLCGSDNIKIIGGREFYIDSLEVE